MTYHPLQMEVMCISESTPRGPRNAFPGRKGQNVWLPRADMDIAHAQGYAKVSDLVPVSAERVMFEDSEHGPRPTGIVAKYMSFADGVKAIRKLDSDRLMHVGLLMEKARLARRFKVHKSTVTLWTQTKTFPDPVATFGNSDVYYYPEVLVWVRERNKGRFRPKKRKVM